MLSNSLIFVVINVMLLIPMYPISRHIKLDMKARRNHRPNDARYSGFAVIISSLKNTLAQRYNFYQFIARHRHKSNFMAHSIYFFYQERKWQNKENKILL